MIASLAALAVAATSLPPQSKTPEAAVASFVQAFSSMDEVRFGEFFAPEITMFFPDGPFPRGRIDGRESVLSAFHGLFKLAKERGRSALKIVPLGQRVQQYGNVAVITFGLDQEGAVGRRTLVLRAVRGEWRIVHFHASTIDR
jgi:ketosteroid isomerase-like protein